MFRIFSLASLFFLSACSQTPGAPSLKTNAIIEVYNKSGDVEGLVLVDSSENPSGKTLPGGKIEYGERLETAIRRLIKSQINMELREIKQFHVYSSPIRDNNYHVLEITVLAKGIGTPRPSREAINPTVTPIRDIPWGKFAPDKERILRDYIDYQKGKRTNVIWIPTL